MAVSFSPYIIEHGLQKAARMRFIGHNLFGDEVGADGEADDGDAEKVSAQCDKVSARNDKAAETMAGSTKIDVRLFACCKARLRAEPTIVPPGIDGVHGEDYLPILDRGPRVPGRDAGEYKLKNIARAH